MKLCSYDERNLLNYKDQTEFDEIFDEKNI